MPSRNATAIQIMCDFSEHHLFIRQFSAFSHLTSGRLILEDSVICDMDLMNFTELGSNWVLFLDLQTLGTLFDFTQEFGLSGSGRAWESIFL